MSTSIVTDLPRHTTLSKAFFAVVTVISVLLLIASALRVTAPTLSLSLSLSGIAVLVVNGIAFIREPRQIQKRYIELMAPR